MKKWCFPFTHPWSEWVIEKTKAPTPPPGTKGHMLYLAKSDTETKRRFCPKCGKKQEIWIR